MSPVTAACDEFRHFVTKMPCLGRKTPFVAVRHRPETTSKCSRRPGLWDVWRILGVFLIQTSRFLGRLEHLGILNGVLQTLHQPCGLGVGDAADAGNLIDVGAETEADLADTLCLLV